MHETSSLDIATKKHSPIKSQQWLRVQLYPKFIA